MTVMIAGYGQNISRDAKLFWYETSKDALLLTSVGILQSYSVYTCRVTHRQSGYSSMLTGWFKPLVFS